MTTLTSLIRPAAAAPAFRVATRGLGAGGLVALCVSALIAGSFVLDVARGASRPGRQAVVQEVGLT